MLKVVIFAVVFGLVQVVIMGLSTLVLLSKPVYKWLVRRYLNLIKDETLYDFLEEED